jgi:hypothetical protein
MENETEIENRQTWLTEFKMYFPTIMLAVGMFSMGASISHFISKIIYIVPEKKTIPYAIKYTPGYAEPNELEIKCENLMNTQTCEPILMYKGQDYRMKESKDRINLIPYTIDRTPRIIEKISYKDETPEIVKKTHQNQ